jgi:hypothetical protein
MVRVYSKVEVFAPIWFWRKKKLCSVLEFFREGPSSLSPSCRVVGLAYWYCSSLSLTFRVVGRSLVVL